MFLQFYFSLVYCPTWSTEGRLVVLHWIQLLMGPKLSGWNKINCSSTKRIKVPPNTKSRGRKVDGCTFVEPIGISVESEPNFVNLRLECLNLIDSLCRKYLSVRVEENGYSEDLSGSKKLAHCGTSQCSNCSTSCSKCSTHSPSDDKGVRHFRMKRQHSVRVVQHSRTLLKGWRANCDIKLLLYFTNPQRPDINEIDEVCRYVVAYTAKKNHTSRYEKTIVQDLIQG